MFTKINLTLLLMAVVLFSVPGFGAAEDWTLYPSPDTEFISAFSVFEDSQGNIWVGNADMRKNKGSHFDIIFKYDGSEWTNFSTEMFTDSPTGDEIVSDITEDNSGHVWFTCGEIGIIEYLGDDNWNLYTDVVTKEENYIQNSNRGVNVIDTDVHDILDIISIDFDSSNNLWGANVGDSGFSGGYVFFDRSNPDPSSAWISETNPEIGIPLPDLFEVYVDSQDNVWFSSADKTNPGKEPMYSKVYRYDISEEEWSRYNAELPGDLVRGITEDDEGNIWFSSYIDPLGKGFSLDIYLVKFDGSSWSTELSLIDTELYPFVRLDYGAGNIYASLMMFGSKSSTPRSLTQKPAVPAGLGIYNINDNNFQVVNPDHLDPPAIMTFSVQYTDSGIYVGGLMTGRILKYGADLPIVVEESNIPGSPGNDITNVIIYENQTYEFFFDGYDPDGNPLLFSWLRNGTFVGSGSKYTFVPDPVKGASEYEMEFTVTDAVSKNEIVYQWNIMVLNNDNPIVVNDLTPAPNTSTDPSISTAGGSYNMTEGETLNFSVDADDPDGSLLWRNWYVNDELVWLDPDFDFNTHFMSSGGSPYDIKLYLQGQQGDYQEFHWTVNVSNKEAVTYANSPMILSGTAMIEGLNAESGDAIAAYSGDELRGEILLSNSNFDNFTVNLSENNEEISFVIYDSNNNIIKTVHRTISGEINTAQEITLHGYKEVSNSFVLAENWNYVSFNTIPEDNSVSSVFTNMNVSQIQTVNEIYNPSNPEFLNTLKEIKPGIGYLVKMNFNSSIFVNGYSAENSEIQLHEGWNLIGYTERSSADIETAFGSIMDKIIEIKSETGVFSADMPAYMNTLSTIEKNKAYWVKCSEDCVLDFPSIEDKRHNSSYLENQDFNKVTSSFSAEGNGLRDTRSTSPTRPPVDVSFGNITVRTNSFVVYAEIKNPVDNTIYAYANNELRGTSQIVENNNRYYTSIVVNSDIAGEEISLKINNNTIKTIESVPGETIGKENLLQLDGCLENEIPTSFKVSLFPNPFNPEINISFELPKAERVNISVFDINGKLVKTLEDNVFNSGKHSITWNGTDSNNDKMASGIYFVKVKSDSYNTTEKIVMLK